MPDDDKPTHTPAILIYYTPRKKREKLSFLFPSCSIIRLLSTFGRLFFVSIRFIPFFRDFLPIFSFPIYITRSTERERRRHIVCVCVIRVLAAVTSIFLLLLLFYFIDRYETRMQM